MAHTKGVFLSIKVPAKLTKRKKWYLASCPILDVHSQGETQSKAKENLVEALSLFLVSCLERNTLDAVLRDCGMSVDHVSTLPKKKPVVSPKNYIDVPIPLLVNRSQNCGCPV